MCTSIEDRCIGSLLCHMIGDQLGAGVEGYSSGRIRFEYGIVRDAIKAPHMGIEELGPRLHMYTDDTNAMLALADSIVKNNGLKAKHAALSYAEFWSTGVKRGYPDSAQESMQAVLDGKINYQQCGRIAFTEGSYANGGAMRIVPLALAFRNATDEQLYEAVRMAIISSHVHPESIDGAFVLAKAVIFAVRCESIDQFDSLQFLHNLYSTAKTRGMRNQIKKLIEHYQSRVSTAVPSLIDLLKKDVDMVRVFGHLFQIKAIEAIPCVLWIVSTGYQDPEQCLIRAVNMGGDTDTVAAMVGDIVGALHGQKWIPHRWYDHIESNTEENLHRGKEFAIELAKKLAMMNLTTIIFDD